MGDGVARFRRRMRSADCGGVVASAPSVASAACRPVAERANLRRVRMRYLIHADRAGAARLCRHDFRRPLRTNESCGERHKYGQRRQQQTQQRHREGHHAAPSAKSPGAVRRCARGTLQAPVQRRRRTRGNARRAPQRAPRNFRTRRESALRIMAWPPSGERSCARRFFASGARAGGDPARRCPPCR